MAMRILPVGLDEVGFVDPDLLEVGGRILLIRNRPRRRRLGGCQGIVHPGKRWTTTPGPGGHQWQCIVLQVERTSSQEEDLEAERHDQFFDRVGIPLRV